jgi:hypothetical protein
VVIHRRGVLPVQVVIVGGVLDDVPVAAMQCECRCPGSGLWVCSRPQYGQSMTHTVSPSGIFAARLSGTTGMPSMVVMRFSSQNGGSW